MTLGMSGARFRGVRWRPIAGKMRAKNAAILQGGRHFRNSRTQAAYNEAWRLPATPCQSSLKAQPFRRQARRGL